MLEFSAPKNDNKVYIQESAVAAIESYNTDSNSPYGLAIVTTGGKIYRKAFKNPNTRDKAVEDLQQKISQNAENIGPQTTLLKLESAIASFTEALSRLSVQTISKESQIKNDQVITAETLVAELPLSQRTINRLDENGLRTTGQLLAAEYKHLIQIHGLGTRGVMQIAKVLYNEGLKFSDPLMEILARNEELPSFL